MFYNGDKESVIGCEMGDLNDLSDSKLVLWIIGHDDKYIKLMRLVGDV